MSEEKDLSRARTYHDIGAVCEELVKIIKGPENQKERLKNLYKRCGEVCDILDALRAQVSGYVVHSYLDSRYISDKPFLPLNIRLPSEKLVRTAFTNKDALYVGSWVKIVYTDKSFIPGVIVEYKTFHASRNGCVIKYTILQTNKKTIEYGNNTIHFRVKELDLPGRLWVLRHTFNKLIPYVKKWRDQKMVIN